MTRKFIPFFLVSASLVAQVPANRAPFSTFLKAHSSILQVATDPLGFIYVFGDAPDSTDSNPEVFVARLDPAATKLIYVVNLGGSDYTSGSALAVDPAGNAYVTGYTDASDFTTVPPVPGPTAVNAQVPFVAKIAGDGKIVYSTLFSNGARGIPYAIGVDTQGRAVVSGLGAGAGFPVTPGAYNRPGTTVFPFTTKLDASGAGIVFSVVGVGGSRLVIDGSDNIFIAGSTVAYFGPVPSDSYPTTPGAFQTTFAPFSYCSFICQLGPVDASEQYVTKLSADGSKLIYSTFVTGSRGAANAGMAVDTAGDVWLTGDTSSPDYPYTQNQGSTPSDLFTTELDPTGSRLLLSVPIGIPPGNGNNLSIDPQGNLIAAGTFPVSADLLANPKDATPAPVAPTETRPPECVSASPTGLYILRINSRDGSLLDSRILQGRNVASSVDSQGNVYLAGSTILPDTPLTPGVFYDAAVAGRTSPGAWLERTNFSAPPGPIGCITDSTSMTLVGPVAPGQLITLYGTGIGPAEPVAGLTGGEAGVPTSVGGVSVTFDGLPAPILYASSTQINVQVPFEVKQEASTVMQLSYGSSVSQTRLFAVTPENPSLFVLSTVTNLTCGNQTTSQASLAFALNQDGSLNSCANPATVGSQFTLFVNGIGAAADNRTTGSLTGSRPATRAQSVALFFGSYSFEVDSFSDQPGAISGVAQVTARVPATIQRLTAMNLTLTLDGLNAGPLTGNAPLAGSATSLPVVVFVKP